MKTLVVKKNKTVSLLTMFAFLVLATFPALGTTEFEIGTRFGISYLVPDADDDSISQVSLMLIYHQHLRM